MRSNWILLLAIIIHSCLTQPSAGAESFRADTPVVPNASPAARSLLAYLSETYGRKTLSGQQEGHRRTNGTSFELHHIQQTTGKLPAILGLDVMHATLANRPSGTNAHPTARRALEWSARNGIVTICWHWYAPAGRRAFYSKETDYDFTPALKPGSEEHAALMRDIDLVSDELKVLRDADVPVLWRPLHEANGRWFWWGMQGPDAFRELWQLMFDRMTATHQLTNLLWVFSPGASIDLAAWYPGDAFVDIIGQDHYPMDGNNGPAKNIFDELVALGRSAKLVGMSENGPIPDPERMFAEKAPWLFYITWAGTMLTEKNPPEQLKRAYQHPSVVNLSDLPANWKRHPSSRASQPANLAFIGAPENRAINGSSRLPVLVAVWDQHGLTVRDGVFDVTLSTRKQDGDSASWRSRTVNGIASFETLKLGREGVVQLEAQASDLKPAASSEFRVGPGNGLVRETWTNGEFRNLRELAEASSPPGNSEKLEKCFETLYQPATNYAARHRGWLLPETSGEHRFWITGSGEVEFWLSTDADPTNRVLIAKIDGHTPYAKWPHTSEAVSAPVQLRAGRRYYLEVLHRQPAGSRHLSVRWLRPGQTMQQLIGADRLQSFPDNENKVAQRDAAD